MYIDVKIVELYASGHVFQLRRVNAAATAVKAAVNSQVTATNLPNTVNFPAAEVRKQTNL